MEIVAKTYGFIAKVSLNNPGVINPMRFRGNKFISYDSHEDIVIISNRGTFKADKKKPLELFDYSKG
jgi:hypothetical protein